MRSKGVLKTWVGLVLFDLAAITCCCYGNVLTPRTIAAKVRVLWKKTTWFLAMRFRTANDSKVR